ncbi:MAG TPA: hypothetical protein VGF56_10830 [Rhizomicrobium sp.]|jgi:hypothetical protein
MSVYNELRTRIFRAYRDAGNGFHPAEAQQKINDAFNAFQGPFEEIGGAIDRQRAGLYPSADAFKTAAGDVLRVIDADMDVLRAAIENAKRADNAKIARVIVDQSVAVRQAKVQQAADASMFDQTTKLVQQIRTDVDQAAAITPPGGASLPRLTPVDVKALKDDIAARAAPKEDALAAEQLKRIGGQIDPD